MRERLEQKDIKLTFSDAVFAHLTKEGYNPQYGARPLKRLIQTKVLTPIASLMVSKGISKGGSVHVDINKAGEFTFTVKKGKNGSFVTDGFINESALA